MTKPLIIMGIDPSINDCGVAIFNARTKKCIHHELIHPNRKVKTYQEKSASIFERIKNLLISPHVNHIILEVPEYWNVGGFVSRESMALSKVFFICGMIYSITYDWNYGQTIDIRTPSQWKGQMPKNVCKNRLRKFYGESIKDFKKIDHNVMDAIGLCHYYMYGKV